MVATWHALESNPSCFNLLLSQLGIKSVKTDDVYTFEKGAFGNHPYALLLCVPNYEQAREYLDEQYKDLALHGVKPAEGVFVAKQKIENACGTFALFNVLANLEGRVDLGDGEFKKWLEEAKKVGVEERSDLIEKNKAIADAHEAAAKNGDTVVLEKVDNHFIAYVNKGDVIYEIDSRGLFPRTIGTTSESMFLTDCGRVIRDFMDNINSSNFAVLAVLPA